LTQLRLYGAVLAAAIAALGTSRASAEALLLIEAESGKVLYAENATYPWYPASLTKLMTIYVVLHAVKDRRLTLDSLITVSQFASVQKPAKMGLIPGMQVTVDNALKMLMVRSANDVAVVLAEGVSGSVENFADQMNTASMRLGMTQSSFVNPNGMPAEDQISSARDLAILARALIREFAEYDLYWRVPAIRYGGKVTQNYNKLLGRFPGTDGMKTGFICASGFNLVASATRNGRRLIAVVLGSASSGARTAKAVLLLERGFNGAGLAWLAPSLGTVETLPAIDAAPPDLRDVICGPQRKKPAAENEEDDETVANKDDLNPQQTFKLSNMGPAHAKPSSLLGPKVEAANPIEVYVGPARKPAESQFIATRAKLNGGRKPASKPDKSTSRQINQVASAPASQTAPAPGGGSLPTVADSAPPLMSFVPAAAPSAADFIPAPMPMPVPRPRPNTKPNPQ
jgi:D-alanyl-D-alanine carboxypeptidase